MTEVLERLKSVLADRYAIERELGHGGMATVYLAHDLKHHRPVAVKVLRPELAVTLGPERFLREIEIAAQLSHPHVLPLLDSGEAMGFLYYVMPYVREESLRDRLDHERRLPLADALRITTEVADALAYAHAQGIIHRDVKPENILLQADHAVVADFGIAQALSAVGGARLTAAGVSLGTPAYMSPEQAAGEAELDGRSDVYSLGCVLYELLAGEPPFRAPTAQGLLLKKLHQETPGVSAVRPEVPPALEAVVKQALARDPADRFATAGQFAAALAAATSPAAAVRPAVGTLLAVGIVVLLLTRAFVLLLGLPDWLWQGASAVVVVGVPAVLAGEWRGWGRRRRWLTRHRALAVGGAALLVIVLSGATYLTSHALGVGPFATPISRGQIEAQARVVLADYAPVGVDTSIADAVTQLLRVDLGQSRAIRILAWDDVSEALARMRREGARLETGTALELARREGLAAVIGGEVRRVGGQYLLLASLTAAADSAVLTSMRETARDSSDLIAGAERLSRKLRARLGENLRNVRASEPLARVTTSSLSALVAYTNGVRADRLDRSEAIRLLKEAIARDSAFAMAHRKLSSIYYNSSAAVAARAAADRAFHFRARLPEIERLLVEAAYYGRGDVARPAEEKALIGVLELDPDNTSGLNSLSDLRLRQRRFAEAESLALHAFNLSVHDYAAPYNAVEAQVAQQRFGAADSVMARRIREAPEVFDLHDVIGNLLLAKRDYRVASAYFDSLHQNNDPYPQTLARLALLQGRLSEAVRYRGETVDFWWRRYELRYFGADTAHAAHALDARLAQIGWDTIPAENRATWLLVALLSELGRTTEARRRLAQWRQAGTSDTRLAEYVDYCEGVIALAEGRLEEATTAFLRWNAAPFSTYEHWYNRGLVEAADAFDRMGWPDTATALLQRAVSLRTLHRSGVAYEALWYPFVLRRLGELHESLGHRDQAIDYYGRFIDLWRDADPQLQPQVEAVRKVRARLLAQRA